MVLATSAASPKEREDLGPAPEQLVIQPPSCMTSEETELAKLINDYRALHGLSVVPLSSSLTEVAKRHAFDLKTNKPSRQTDPNGKPCSLHSWSGGGPWSPICYTRDHACAEAMREKPRELSGYLYRGNGFENAYWTSRPLTPQLALQAWKKSPAHNALLLQEGSWGREPWAAMGVALFDHFAVVWFGDAADPLGECSQCAASRTSVAQDSSQGAGETALPSQNDPMVFSASSSN